MKKPVKPPQCKYVELNGLRVLLILSLFERVCRYVSDYVCTRYRLIILKSLSHCLKYS